MKDQRGITILCRDFIEGVVYHLRCQDRLIKQPQGDKLGQQGIEGNDIRIGFVIDQVASLFIIKSTVSCICFFNIFIRNRQSQFLSYTQCNGKHPLVDCQIRGTVGIFHTVILTQYKARTANAITIGIYFIQHIVKCFGDFIHWRRSTV